MTTQPNCEVCQEPLHLLPLEERLLDKLAFSVGGTRFEIPPRRRCAKHERQRRWAFRNERQLYKAKCARSGKSIVSHLASTTPYTIIDQKLWWESTWDGTEYGREIDFNRPFFEQFGQLLREVPHPNLMNALSSNDNSDFVNCTTELKNCYMIFDGGQSEDALYCEMISLCRSCIDCTNLLSCELCYDTIDSVRCYQGRTLIQCEGCSDSSFLYDCKGCHHCFMSVGLRNASFFWKNEQLTREEYEKRIENIPFTTRSVYEDLRQEFTSLVEGFPRRAAFVTQCEDCTGNSLINSKNALSSFDATNLHDCTHVISINGGRDSMHVEHIAETELSYQVMAATKIYRTLFSAYPINTTDVTYGYLVSSSRSCFGCACLKNQEFCILNKKYSKSEYERLTVQLISHMQSTGEWGEFFPMKFSPFPYNDTLAHTLVPLDQITAHAQELYWEERDPSSYSTSNHGAVTPDQWDASAAETLAFHAYRCVMSSRLFKLIPQELTLYLKLEVPLPDKHPDERYFARLSWRGPRELNERTCAHCEKSLLTVFSESQAPEVLCDECYLLAVR